MTKSTITREQTQQIIDAADAVITALAGTNDEVHKDDTDNMISLWDDLNDRHAPPEVVRELARMALAAMDQKPALHRYRRKAVEPYGPYPWHYEEFVDYPRPVEGIEDEYFYAAPPVVTGVAVDSEPVAWTWHYREKWHVTNDERRAEFVAKDGDVAVLPLYRHAQSAQISEPVLPLQDKDLQGVIDALEHPAGINAAGKQVVRHALVEIQERRKADREPVAEVVSIYGDPEAFGEREIRPLVGIQQMPYGTKLYRHAQPAPVVQMVQEEPPEHLLPKGNSRDTTYRRGAIILGWKLCRAAMLNGGKS